MHTTVNPKRTPQTLTSTFETLNPYREPQSTKPLRPPNLLFRALSFNHELKPQPTNPKPSTPTKAEYESRNRKPETLIKPESP